MARSAATLSPQPGARVSSTPRCPVLRPSPACGAAVVGRAGWADVALRTSTCATYNYAVRVKAMEWAGAGISAVVTTLVLAAGSPAWAIQCEKLQTADKDLEVQVSAVIAKVGPIKGAEADAKVKSAARQVLEKLPNADRLILHHLMYFTYCTTLRDDSTISETERSKRINEYNRVLMKALQPSSPPQRPDPSPKARPPAAETQEKPVMNAPGGMNIRDSVVINPTINNIAPPLDQDAQSELKKIRKLLDSRFSEEKLKTAYPVGYAIFRIDGTGERHFFEVQLTDQYQIDWSVVRIVDSTPQRITIQLPDVVHVKSGNRSSNNSIDGRKRVGPNNFMTWRLRGTPGSDEHIDLITEILEIQENGIVLLMGLRRGPPFLVKPRP